MDSAHCGSVELNHREAAILAELINDLCNETADGGSIPPRHWRTAANKMRAVERDLAALDEDDVPASAEWLDGYAKGRADERAALDQERHDG